MSEPRQPIDYPDSLELLLRDPKPFKSPAAQLPQQADLAASRGSFTPTSTAFDRDVAVTVFVILFGITPILFVYAMIKLFE